MKISRRPIGTFSDPDSGREVMVEALRAEITGRLHVEAWTYGATLVEVAVPDRGGRLANVCLRLGSLAQYTAQSHYIGPIMGRFARCVRNGLLILDGQRHQLDRNIDGHHFHGGTRGFDRFVWQGDIEAVSDSTDLVFRLDRPDRDQGYPGAVSVEVRYRVMHDGSLRIVYRGTTNAPTIMGLTSHAFWNLAGSGRIDDHRLAVNAERYISADQDFMPHPGPPMPTRGSAHDLRQPQQLGNRSIDLCYVLDRPELAARLEDPASGRVMTVTTDQPGLAVYSGDGLAQARAGIALQTGAWPDAPNRPDFPSARLDPEETYIHRAHYVFDVTG